MLTLIRCLAIALLAMTPLVARAQDTVQLRTLDGSISVEGKLLSYDGHFFRIETSFGAVTLDGGNVTCTGAACPSDEDMVSEAMISGSAALLVDLVAPLMQAFAARQGYELQTTYLAERESLWVLSDADVTPERTIARLRVRASTDPGESDLHISWREAGRRTASDVIALDGIVAIVAPDNPSTSVTSEALQLYLSGKLSEWPGLNAPIRIHLPDNFLGASVTDLPFWSAPFRLANNSLRHSDFDALADAVTQDPNALGLTLLTRIGSSAPLVLTGSCGRALPATRAHIKSEDYPLTRAVYLNRMSARLPKVMRDFVAYTRSREAQSVVRRAGFVDQAVGRIPFAAQGDRLANAVLKAGENADDQAEMRRMIRTLVDGERLTLTFRFEDGSSDLDGPSRSNIQRLADAIDDGAFDGQELAFVGFSDGLGPSDGNLRLSQRRAKRVYDAVAATTVGAPVTFAIDGFGEAMPMACDDTAWGRQVNRRVEVWLRQSKPSD